MIWLSLKDWSIEDASELLLIACLVCPAMKHSGVIQIVLVNGLLIQSESKMTESKSKPALPVRTAEKRWLGVGPRGLREARRSLGRSAS